MKNKINLVVFLTLQISLAFGQGSNQTLMINTEGRIDSTGNAIFDVSGKLTAQQWINWNYMFGGGNASNVKRTYERALSFFYVYDFKYNPNEMERSFTIQFKAKGVIEYLGKDKWVANLGLREVQPVKLTENSFNCVLAQGDGNNILQNNMRFTLPANATNMVFDKDEFNNVLVYYKMPTESVTTFGDSGMKTDGYSLLGLGLLSFLGILAFRKKIS